MPVVMLPDEASAAPRGVTSARQVVLGVAVAVGLTILAAAGGAAVTGAVAPSSFADPGTLVRWGRPAVGALADLSAALAVGTLVLALAALPQTTARGRRAHLPALQLTSVAAAVWALAGLARLVLGYASATGQGLDAPDLGTQLASFVTQVDTGRAAATGVLLAALTATVAAGATGVVTARLLLVPAAGALVADVLARDVHSGAAEGPAAVAVRGAVVLHTAGAAVWVGGLAGLVLLARGLGGALPAAAVRYTRLVPWGVAVVAVSGVVVSWPRLGSADGLATGYGAVLLAKLALLVVLGVLGAAHRRRVLPGVAAGSRPALLRAGAVELAVAVVAVGLSAALAATDPPAGAVTRAVTLAVHSGH